MAGVKKSGRASGKGRGVATRGKGGNDGKTRGSTTGTKDYAKGGKTKVSTKGTTGGTKGTKDYAKGVKTKAKRARTTAAERATPSARRLPARTIVRIRELDPYRKCGPGTSVERLIRVDEEVAGRRETHLVYFDRHGWYCEHGRTCHAVKHARKGIPVTR